jgi:formylglycine-generating enzyme required for sulfatase activity
MRISHKFLLLFALMGVLFADMSCAGPSPNQRKNERNVASSSYEISTHSGPISEDEIVNLSHLPNEIKIQILQKLTPREFEKVGTANKDLRRLVKDPVVRKGMFENWMKSLGIKLISLPGRTFQMGSPENEVGRRLNERRHQVTLSPFEIMDAAVTQKTYALIMGSNPSRFQNREDCQGEDGQSDYAELKIEGRIVKVCADHPVEQVSWNDSQQFIKKLNDGLEGSGYRFKLPTEAQYEYAFRGGTTTAFVSGENESGLGDYVWYTENSGDCTHSVRSKRPNAYGIYRSSVWEWALDWFEEYPSGQVTDPTGPLPGTLRVVRGCSWRDIAGACRSAWRLNHFPGNTFNDVGFRLSRTE